MLAANEFVGSVDRSPTHPDEVEQIHRALLPVRGLRGRKGHWQFDVLLRGESRHGVEELEDEADAAEAISDEVRVAQVNQVRAVEIDSARRRPVDASEHVEQCRLPATRGPR